jgi:oxygen-dependent protoporphyrinogen oxidase
VKAIRPSAEGGYALDVAASGAGAPAGETFQADAVVLAIPAYDASALLAPLSPTAGDILGTFRYVSTGTMSVAFEQSDSLERIRKYGFGVLSPTSEQRPLNAITCSSTKFDHRAPDGHALIRIFFGGSRSPGTMLLDDDEIATAIKKQLRDILGVTEEPLFHRIYRWERANPQYDVEHLTRVDALERALPPGLWVTGSPYRGVGIPDCVHQGQMTADLVVARLKDQQRSGL